jgi:hypothetical protein
MNFFQQMKKWIMINKHNLIVLLTSIAISLAIWLNTFHKKQRNTSSVKALTFHAVEGWGYDILVDDILFIHQASIPCLNGKQGFAKKEQAEKTASLIINKIENGESPVVTIFDLQKIIPINQLENDNQGKVK